jgi:NADH:ubiquinone oxidoreductase subunit 4 (chain M)
MSSWPILSLVTFLPLVGALFCLVVNGPNGGRRPQLQGAPRSSRRS